MRRSSSRKGVIKRGEDEPGLILENIRKIPRQKTTEDIKFIIDALKGHFVFYSLTQAELEKMVVAMFCCQTYTNQFIFKQGDKASSFFLLEKGLIEVIINDEKKREIHSGEGFGELAILYNAPRSASLKCVDDCTFWGIDRMTFRKTLSDLVNREVGIFQRIHRECQVLPEYDTRPER